MPPKTPSQSTPPETIGAEGGLARYCVEHRAVAWAALIGMLVWGWFSFGKLAQQEDPKIPERRALLVTHFPGASATKVEQLVTRKLEKKVSELASLDDMSSQSRTGVSIIRIALQFGSTLAVEQEWDKLRAKLGDVVLPEGCGKPFLDTDFGNTLTLLIAVTSQPISEAECLARALLVRSHLEEGRQKAGLSSANRAAVAVFFPPAVSPNYREVVTDKFVACLASQNLGHDPRVLGGASFRLVDFVPHTHRQGIRQGYNRFVRELAGTEGQLHPDYGPPLVLMGQEDPLPQIRATAMPRYSYRQLEIIAEALEDELKQLSSVARVRPVGVVNETVHLLFSLPKVTGFSLSSLQVIKAIADRNAIIPSGTFRSEGQNFPVQLSGEFKDEQELMGAIVGLSGEHMPVYLRDIFEVRRGYENPIPYNVNVLKRTPKGDLREIRSVLLGIEMKEGRIIRQFDRDVQATLARIRDRLPDGVELVTISNQPEAVAQRVRRFMGCFGEAVMIVVIVCLFLMDWRSALVVAAAIPLTLAMTLGGMHLFAIPLHQISIATMILALGMLVDDPVVASDGINREIAHGQPRGIAAWLGPYRLRRAIFFATIINIVAFLPLVLLPDDKGAFIFSLPMVILLALVSSRVVSMTFVPVLGYYLLRGQKGLEHGGDVRRFPLFRPIDQTLVALLPRYQHLLHAALDRPWTALAMAYGLLIASFGMAPFFGQQFFPPAERNQCLVDIDLPESASITQTRETCAEVVRILKAHREINTAAVFMGGTAPRFYYNVEPREPGDNLAQVLINTHRAEDVPPLLAKLRTELDREIAGARCVVKQLEQGPPVDTPIQIRLSGDDPYVLRGLADRVGEALRQANAYKVHDDLGRPIPTLQINIDQERANTLGIDNSLIGRLTRAAFYGLKVTELREGDHLVPVVIRLRAEERNEVEKLRTLYVESTLHQAPIPLANFANITLTPEFAAINHYNQLRTVTVKAFPVFNELASATLQRARSAIQKTAIPAGYRLEFAGEAKELKTSQKEMGEVMLISLALIAFSLVVQFGSITKSLAVMLTVPLGLIGAFLGLAVTGSALGFMALLGIVSLAGVIVSHIIVLSDFIEEARAKGMELKPALIQAGLVRLRPVLATVLATVGGLIPLALTGGELWRPLTAVHIFGLLLATLLTLVMLPVLYYAFCARLKWIK